MISRLNIALVLALASAFIALATSQTVSSCPKFKALNNFNHSRLVGQWFMTHKMVKFETKYQIDTNAFKDFNGTCTFINMTYSKKTNSFSVYMATVLDGTKAITSNRTAKINSDGTFQQKVKFLTCE